MPFTQPKFEPRSVVIFVVMIVVVERVFLAERPESQAALADRLASPIGPPVNKQLKVSKQLIISKILNFHSRQL